VFLDVVT